jgi:hypothetical protein
MLDKLAPAAEETARQTAEDGLSAFAAGNMWTHTGQPRPSFTAGAFSRANIYSRTVALQIEAIELAKAQDKAQD